MMHNDNMYFKAFNSQFLNKEYVKNTKYLIN